MRNVDNCEAAVDSPFCNNDTRQRGGGNSRGVAVSSLLLQKGRGKRSLMFEK